ncbi:hypothetical protein IVA86_33200 [Bradyrhizobium sp. 146]|uniref:hypothetical protein n=1 Tax=Bradyrhizobium sp. 146 TaxID=2782622 RepID=UPI001FFBE303|nr:hypothetical protein [Bradyrhizobium sp. 146]MCK1706131.1 hypothetical protein [Bradyrhizobium sp. 146]
MVSTISPEFLRRQLAKIEQEATRGEPSLKGGGSDGTFDDMEARVSALEEGLKRIENKLDQLGDRTSEMKGQLSGMPSAATFGDIKGALGKLEGRVDALPTTAKLGALLALAVAAITIVTKWSELMAALRP